MITIDNNIIKKEIFERLQSFISNLTLELDDPALLRAYENGIKDAEVTEQFVLFTEIIAPRIFENYIIDSSQINQSLLDEANTDRSLYIDLYLMLLRTLFNIALLRREDVTGNVEWTDLLVRLTEQWELLESIGEAKTEIQAFAEDTLSGIELGDKPEICAALKIYLKNDDLIQGDYQLINQNIAIREVQNGQILAENQVPNIGSVELTSIPVGFDLDPVTGAISITDKNLVEPGSYSLVVNTTDEKGGRTTSLIEFELSSNLVLNYTISDPKIIDAYTNNDVLAFIDGAQDTVKKVLLEQGKVPSGMLLNPLTGELTVNNKDGLIVGQYTLQLGVYDIYSVKHLRVIQIDVLFDNEAVYTVNMHLDINDISTGETIATAFDLDGDITNAVATGLPVGLSLDPATGIISVTDSTVLESGEHVFNVTTVDSTGVETISTIRINLESAVADPYYVTAAPKKVQNYSNDEVLATLKNISEVKEVVVFSGTLPPGVSLDASSGIITVSDATLLVGGEYFNNILITKTDDTIFTLTSTIVIEPDFEAFYRTILPKSIHSFIDDEIVGYPTDVDGTIVSATLEEGTLPEGISLDATTGELKVEDGGLLQSGIGTFKIKTVDELNGETISRINLFLQEPSEAFYVLVDPKNVDAYENNEIIGEIESPAEIIGASVVSGQLPRGVRLNTTTGEIFILSRFDLIGGLYNGIQIKSEDKLGNSTIHEISIELTPDRDAVYILSPVKAANLYENGDVLATVSDPDGPLVVASILRGGLVPGAAMNTTTGEIYVYNKDFLQSGSYGVRIFTKDVTDGISVHNLLVEIGIVADLEAQYTSEPARNVDSYIDTEVIATPFDPNGAIVSAVILTGQLAAGTVLDASNGVIRVTDKSLLVFGTYSAEVMLTDSLGGTSTAVVTYTFNPDIEAVYTVNSIVRIDLLNDGDVIATVTDGDGPIIYASIISGTLPSGLSLNSLNGSIFVQIKGNLAAMSETVVIGTTDSTGGYSENSVEIVIATDSEAVYTIKKARFVNAIRNGDVMAFAEDPDGDIVSATVTEGIVLLGTELKPNGEVVVIDRNMLQEGVNHSFQVETTDVLGGTTTTLLTLVTRMKPLIIKDKITPGICERLGDIVDNRPKINQPEHVLEKTLKDFTDVIFKKVCSDLSKGETTPVVIGYKNGSSDVALKNAFLSIMMPTSQNILDAEITRGNTTDQTELDKLNERQLILSDLYNEQLEAMIHIAAFKDGDISNNANDAMNILFDTVASQMQSIKAIAEMAFVLENIERLKTEYPQQSGKPKLYQKINSLL